MPLQFDIRAILKSKAPNTKVPNFVVRYLERIAHIKQMNAFLRKYPDLRDYDFIRLVISEELGCSAEIDGVANIPSGNKPLIFVSNHPLGGLDGMIIAQMIHDQIVKSSNRQIFKSSNRQSSNRQSSNRQSSNRQLKVIVNDLLMYMEPIADLWAPVNKVGKVSRDQVLQQQQMWDSETDVLTFPAGACSRLQRIEGKWQIQDLEWQKNFIQRAKEYQRDVVPIYFEGKNSRFFYVLAYLRKLLGIKLNIEMLYLVDEMYGAHGKHFHVHVLPPIPYTSFDNSRTPKEWAQYVKSIVYATRNTPC